MLKVILVLLHLHSVLSEVTDNISLLKQYETNLNSSLRLEREDRILLNSWTVDFQVKRIHVTTKYRMQMNRHKEHSFRRADDNNKWTECLFLHRRQIRKSEKQYYGDESECLITAAAEDKERMSDVEQMEKQSRKWRKGYRYLVHTCSTEHPEDQDASNLCLLQYMEKDNYSKVIQRLINFKLQAMGELFLQLNNSIKDLEECLKTQLSVYLEKVRTIMDTLNKCYSLTTHGNVSAVTE